MKTRYRLIRRGIRNNAFYCVDTTTGKRTNLRTGNLRNYTWQSHCDGLFQLPIAA
jgi:hypothetical protein